MTKRVIRIVITLTGLQVAACAESGSDSDVDTTLGPPNGGAEAGASGQAGDDSPTASNSQDAGPTSSDDSSGDDPSSNAADDDVPVADDPRNNDDGTLVDDSAPAEETPAEETPAEETPSEETPGQQSPDDESPSDDAQPGGDDLDPPEDATQTDDSFSSSDAGVGEDQPTMPEDALAEAGAVAPSDDAQAPGSDEPAGIICADLSSTFELVDQPINMVTLHWNGSTTDAECWFEAGTGSDDLALLRFAQETGTYGPYSLWSGDPPFEYGDGFEDNDPNGLPIGVPMTVLLDVTSPPILVRVSFEFTDELVIVSAVEGL